MPKDGSSSTQPISNPSSSITNLPTPSSSLPNNNPINNTTILNNNNPTQSNTTTPNINLLNINQQSQDIQNVPKDAIIIEKILSSMGIKEHEPRVIEQLLELLYKYIIETIDDSYTYMEHCGRNDLDLEDVRLAIQARVNHSFTNPPPIGFLLDVANQKNNTPFFIPKKQRVLLPPPHVCLSNKNYQLSSQNNRKRRKEEEEMNQESNVDDNNNELNNNMEE